MKVAVASVDGIAISEHFGRSRYMLVFQVEGDTITSMEKREGSYAPHATEDCEARPSAGASHDYHEMVSAIEDCHVVLCRGMGWRAAQELVRSGINPLVIQDELTPQQAVEKYLAGELTPAKGFCRNTGRPSNGP